MSSRFPSLAIATGANDARVAAAPAPTREIITGGVGEEEESGEPVVSLCCVKEVGKKLCGGVPNTKNDDRPRVCLKNWSCRSHKQGNRKEVVPGVYILAPTARNNKAAFRRPMVLMSSLATEECGDFLVATLEGARRMMAIGIMSWIETEPPPSGGERWSIEELSRLQDRYQAGELDSTLHSMGIGTPRGEPFDLVSRTPMEVEDGSLDGRNFNGIGTGVGDPSPNFASAMSQVALDIEEETPSSGISGLTGVPGVDSESVFSFAEIPRPHEEKPPATNETVAQLARRLEEAVKDGKRRLGLLEPAQRRVVQRLAQWEPAQRHSIERLEEWEPKQKRMAMDVTSMLASEERRTRRFTEMDRQLGLKLNIEEFDSWRDGETGIPGRVSTVEKFMEDVNLVLTDPNELPAIVAVVNKLNAFAGLNNRQALKDWLVAQFPSLSASGGRAPVNGRRFGSLSIHSNPPPRGVGRGDGNLEAGLQTRVDRMETQLLQLAQDNAVLRQQLEARPENFVDMLTDGPVQATDDAMQRVAALSERVASLEARGLTEPIRMGQHVFSSVGDVRAFVLKYVGEKANFGVLSDLVILLHKTKTPSGPISQVAINDEITAAKIRLDTVESNILVSFSIILPRPFDSAGGGVGSSADHPLPSIKSYEQWTAPRVGKKTVISREVRNEAKVIGDRIVAARMAPEATQLFELMRRQAISHWDQLAAFIDTNVQTQTMAYKLSPAESWLLTSKCVREAFTSLRAQRIHGQDLISDCESKPEQFARAMWAVLLCHQLLDALFEADVLGHVMMSHVVHEHLLCNKVTVTDLEKVRNTAGAAQTGVTHLFKEVDRLLTHNQLRPLPRPKGAGHGP